MELHVNVEAKRPVTTFPVDQRWHIGGSVPEWIKKEFRALECPEGFLGEEKALAWPLAQPGGQTLHETGAGRSQATRLPRHSVLSTARPRTKL